MQQLITLLLQNQLALILVHFVDWDLNQLSFLVFADHFVVLDNVTFDCDVIVQVLVDYAWRDLAIYFLQSYVLFKSWLEILNNHWFADSHATQIDHCQARVLANGES